MSAAGKWGGAALLVAVLGYLAGSVTQATSGRGDARSESPGGGERFEGSSAVRDSFLRWSEMTAGEVREEYLKAEQDRDSLFASVLLERLAELDIESAFEAAGEDGDTDGIFAVWVRIDPEAAEAEARRIFEEDSESNYEAKIVAMELVAGDPERALALMRDTELNPSQVDDVFQRWAHTDVGSATEAAMAWALRVEGEIDTSYLDGIVTELVHRDPREAMEWLAALPKEWGTDHEEIGERWAMTNPLGMWGALQEDWIGDAKMKKAMAFELLYMSPEALSFEQARALVTEYEGTERALEELGWTFEGEQMAQLIDLSRNLELVDSEVAANAAGEWAETDPIAAAEWAASLKPMGDGWSEVLRGGCSGWAESDPIAAVKFFAALSGELATENDIEYVLDGMLDAGLEPSAGIGLVDRFAPQWRSTVAGELIEDWASENPEQAAAYVAESGSPELLESLASGWDLSDEEGANESVAGWFYERSDSDHGRAGLEEWVSGWVRGDPRAVSQWAFELEEGVGRDVVVGELVDRLRRTDPEAAYRWADTLGEVEGRAEIVDEIWQEWVEFDPAGAAAFTNDR